MNALGVLIAGGWIAVLSIVLLDGTVRDAGFFVAFVMTAIAWIGVARYYRNRNRG